MSAESSTTFDFDIVPFEDAHLDAVVALSLRAWEPVFQSFEEVLDRAVYDAFFPDWREVQTASVTAACTAEDHETWVALSNDATVGFVDLFVHADGVLGEIHMVAVDPAYQRRGIGTRLTGFGIERLRETGASVAMVETGGDPGHAPARRTYEVAGFRGLPVVRYFKKL